MPLETLTWREFEDFGHQLARAALEQLRPGASLGYIATSEEHLGDRKADGVIQDGRFAGSSDGLVLFSYKSSTIADEDKARAALRQRILNEIDEQADRHPTELVVLVNRRFTDRDRARVEAKVAGRFTVSVFGPQQLEDLARPHKHILWRWFDTNPFVTATRCDDGPNVLLRLGIADFPFSIEEAPRHPAFEVLRHRQGNHRVVGQPGSGKSCLIAQYALAKPHDLLITVSPVHFANVWEPLKRMLLDAHDDLIVVFRNFHDLCKRGHENALLDLISIVGEKAARQVTLIAEYRITERSTVSEALSEEAWAQLGFGKEIILDPPPREFIAQVFDAACEEFDVTVTGPMRETCIDGVVEWDNTPLAAVDWMRDYQGSVVGEGEGSAFYPAPLSMVEGRWRGRFEQLRATRNRQRDAALLQTLSLLRCASLPVPDDADFIARCSLGRCGNASLVEESLASLAHEGWIFRAGKAKDIQGHDLRLSPCVVGLLQPDGGAGEDLLLYGRRLLGTVDCPHGTELAAEIGRLLMSCGEWSLAGELLSTVVDCVPSDYAVGARIAICRTHSEEEREVDRGLRDLEEIASSQPDDPRPALALGHALARTRNRQQAVDAIRRLVLRDGLLSVRHQLGAAEGLFELLDVLGAADVSRNILNSALVSPSAKGRAACILAQTGFTREAQKHLEELSAAGTSVLPVMAGLGICYMQTKGLRAALDQFRAAIERYPQDPGLRRFFAECVATACLRRLFPQGDMRTPNHDDSEKIIREALARLVFAEKIFRPLPDLYGEILCWKGLLLIESGERQTGLAALGTAADLRGIARLPMFAQHQLQLADEHLSAGGQSVPVRGG
ncbi:hypothetical protein LCGC14_1818210 [marine sediment metagenome]|uniref:Uncharacterized protein n=1 Tax=marine sediment metagenome TaxID=412755 RepID=A0A0F9GJR6_9ZZZZ